QIMAFLIRRRQPSARSCSTLSAWRISCPCPKEMARENFCALSILLSCFSIAWVVYLYRTDNSGARKSGKIVPFGCMRGQGNGTDPFFLRAGLVGTPVVVPHLIRRSVALRPSCHGSTDLQARQGDPEALQRTQAVSWLNPKAPLCSVSACSPP